MTFRNTLVAVAMLLMLVSVAAAQDDKAATSQPEPVRSIELLAKAEWRYSTDGGKTFTADTHAVPPGKTAGVAAKATFTVDDPDNVVGLWPVPGPEMHKGASFTLNGQVLTGPLKGMYYFHFPVDPKGLLKKGANELVVSGGFRNRPSEAGPAKMSSRLVAYLPAGLGLQSGPMLGAIERDWFTVTCRSNSPATATVTADCDGKKTSATTKRGFYHRLKIPRTRDGKTFTYTLTLEAGPGKATFGPYSVTAPPPPGQPMRFAVAGDGRSNPEVWSKVAAAIQTHKPSFLAYPGDMVGHGKWDHAWDVEFFRPAQALLETVPFYAIIGNHEHYGPAYFELFYTPTADGRGADWSQTIGDVQIVGIDGAQDWTKVRDAVEPLLKGSKAKFLFFFTHYPAWSSSMHGSRREGGMTISRKVIMPMLVQYNATVMIAGHDHTYERLEPDPKLGVTCIVSGGAGAPLYGKRHDRHKDFSKRFKAAHHYIIFDVKGDTCEMKVYDLEGKIIDQRTFKARKIPQAAKEVKPAA